MARFTALLLLIAMTALGMETPPSASKDRASAVTFNKDVLPILQDNCLACHRPNGVAPMSLMTFESARPWAKAIKAAVINKQMPPWFAKPEIGEFRNAPKLTPANIDTLVAWADNGAREGDALDKPTVSPQWVDGWRIQPDVVVAIPTSFVSAKGPGEVREFFIPSPFKEDTWVTSIEIRPVDPSVVHHVIVQVPEQATPPCGDCGLVDLLDNEAELLAYLKELAAARGGEPLFTHTASSNMPVRKDGINIKTSGLTNTNGNRSIGSYSGGASSLSRLRERQTGQGAFMTMEAVYAPGSQPMDFRYTDAAKLIPVGRQIRIEVHYTPNGKETNDKTMVGFTFAKSPAQRRFVMMAPEHLVDTRRPIPAGEENWQTVGELTFAQNADLVWFMPHMHLRGKDMTFRLIHPDGREETVLSATFNFNWQLGYELKQPIKVTRGTRMIVTAHHDNSANNPSNPAPNMSVNWGETTAEEMMLPWFGVVVDRDAKPETIAMYKPGHLDGPEPSLPKP